MAVIFAIGRQHDSRAAEEIMKRSLLADVGVFAILVLLPILFFRQIFTTKQTLAPFNLLVSHFSPWRYYSWPGYPNGVPNKPLGTDNLKLFFPYRLFTIDTLKKGRLPLWNPYVFSGNIHAASYQSAVFYPLSVVFLFLSPTDAWSMMIILIPVLSSWFTYIFLRGLDLSRRSSLLGSVFFAYSGWMISNWQEVLVTPHAILWLPLALHGSTLIWRSDSRTRGFAYLVWALVLSVLAGFLQMSIYLYVTVFFWNFCLFIRHRKSSGLRTKLALAVSGILLSIPATAIQWLPAVEAYLFSPRGKVDASYIFRAFLTPWQHLITLVAPDFWGNPGAYNYFGGINYLQERTVFIGVVALMLALTSISRRSSGYQFFWSVFALISFSFGFALPTSWIWYVLRVPILSAALPVRVFVLSAFGFSVLAAYGFENLFSVKSLQIVRKIIFSLSVVIMVLWFFVAVMFLIYSHEKEMTVYCVGGVNDTVDFLRKHVFDYCDKRVFVHYATISFRNLILPSVFGGALWVQFLFFKNRKNVSFYFFFGLSLVSSYYFAQKILYFSDPRFAYPAVSPVIKLKELSGLNRIWSYGDGYIVRNIPIVFGLYSPEGYDALFSQQYGELMYSIQTGGKLTDQIERTDAHLKGTDNYEIMTDNLQRLRVMAITSTRYILEVKNPNLLREQLPPNARFPEAEFSLVWEDDKWRIWEYKNALPRALLADSYRVETDPQKRLDFLYDRSTDLNRVVILEEDPGIIASSGEHLPDEKVHISSYDSEKVELRVKSSGFKLLYLSDAYYPGWRAFVDGQEVKIYRANYAFRAIPVPKGEHAVEFVYESEMFLLSVWLTSAGLMGIVIGFFVTVRSGQRRKEFLRSDI